jgi:two-component system LytT family sensor kinase
MTSQALPATSAQTPTAMPMSRVVALLLLVGAFFTAEEVLMDVAGRRSELAGRDIANGAVFWAVWAALAPLAVLGIRRWSLVARPLLPPLALHLVAAIALSAVHNVVSFAVENVVAHPSEVFSGTSHATMNGTAFVWGLFTGAIFYASILMVHTLDRYRSLYAAERVEAAALGQELTQAKLDTLRGQLRPHFLFNTLNAISVFVKEDADSAQQMILRLSRLLRRSLDEDAHEVALECELAFVGDYLDIQRGRFGDRLVVDLDVDASARRARVPVFLLQPLLENAIEHGQTAGRCAVALRIARVGRAGDEMLAITVTDEGAGIDTERPLNERVGLTNTRERLRHMYGSRATMILSSTRAAAPRGTRVLIQIPLRAAST